MRLQQRDHLAPLALAAVVALALAGCSRKSTNTYQGYVEGKFVYVASPQSGRLDHLSVARGETIAISHPCSRWTANRKRQRSARRSNCSGFPKPGWLT